MAYTYEQIVDAYRAVGVAPGEVVYVLGNIGNLWTFEEPGKEAVLRAHYNALIETLGPEGTLVCSAASLNLCNTDIVFDPDKTPSNMAGTLSEYIRQQPGTLRSFHPFRSYCAVGRHATYITQDISRAAYGPFSPEARLIELNAITLAVGITPREATSTVHHCEQMMAVPYRYMKEFLHPVARNGVIVTEPFYLYVWYKNSDIVRDKCRTIMADFLETHGAASAPLGRRHVYSFRTRLFYEHVIELMKSNPYIWCETPPTVRPWQQ
tara:strand:+ start:52221 stop:53018 length:798 start_codon:yes stop_codon:yes gene_type:complete